MIIGYGSLMSNYGIHRSLFTKYLKVYKPFIVKFNAYRGFNTKPQRYMDIGVNFDPNGIQVRINDDIDNSENVLECLAFFIKDESLENISDREGYPNGIMKAIKRDLYNCNKKKNEKKDIAEYLWTFYPYQNHHKSFQEKINDYRDNLEVIDVHSYIPHPIKITCQNNKAIFGLISIHADIGAKGNNLQNISSMTITKAKRSNNPPRSTYFQECILGGVHGIDVRDLLSGIEKEGELNNYLEDLEEKIITEWKNTQNWTFHGKELMKNLKRSGLLEYFPELKKIEIN